MLYYIFLHKHYHQWITLGLKFIFLHKMPYVIVEGVLSATGHSQSDTGYARSSLSGGSTPERKPAFQVAVSGLKGNKQFNVSTLELN